MQNYIVGLIREKGNVIPVELFGYDSKGMPGIEILGLGTYGRTVKEKFVFLTKSLGLKIPLRRYVLSVDDKVLRDIKKKDYVYLEFPLLILYLSLAEIIPIKNLSDCFTCGSVQVLGLVVQPDLSHNDLLAVKTYLQNSYLSHIESLKFITHVPADLPNKMHFLDSKEIFSSMPALKFSSQTPTFTGIL
jgi:hypothetical protein